MIDKGLWTGDVSAFLFLSQSSSSLLVLSGDTRHKGERWRGGGPEMGSFSLPFSKGKYQEGEGHHANWQGTFQGKGKVEKRQREPGEGNRERGFPVEFLFSIFFLVESQGSHPL